MAAPSWSNSINSNRRGWPGVGGDTRVGLEYGPRPVHPQDSQESVGQPRRAAQLPSPLVCMCVCVYVCAQLSPNASLHTHASLSVGTSQMRRSSEQAGARVLLAGGLLAVLGCYCLAQDCVHSAERGHSALAGCAVTLATIDCSKQSCTELH